MSKKYSHLEGSVPVNGDITPITRQPIEQIDSSKWNEMSLFELTEQRRILMERIGKARTFSGDSAIVQLERGLFALNSLMDQRAEELDQMEESHLI